MVGENLIEYDAKYDLYGGAIILDESTDESEDNLGSAVAFILGDYTPDYLEVYAAFYDHPSSEDYIDWWGDGSITYIVGLCTPDEAVDVYVTSYIIEGLLVVQIDIYEYVA